MKFTCETSKLSSAVGNVQRSVTTKSSLATLEGVLIRTNSDEIILSGYDLEISITTKIPADISVEGCTVINAKVFGDILRKLPEDRVTIEIVDNRALITSGTSEFSLIALDANEYPEMPSIEDEKEVKIPCDVLKSMISQTIYAVSTLDERPVYKGVLFEVEENVLKLVSADGCRLAIRKEDVVTNQNINFVVPAKALQEILKLIGDDDEYDAVINVGKRHISFVLGDFEITTRLLEGEFLNYNNIIPQEDQTVVITETREFLSIVERISQIITDRIKSPVRCTFSDGQVYMRSSTTMGKASDFLDCEITGENLEIGFNGKFFVDALRAVDTDKIKIIMNGAKSPIKILPLEGDHFLFIVVPVIMKAEN